MKSFNEIKEERLSCEDRIIKNAKDMIEKHKDYYPLYSRYNEEAMRSSEFLKNIDENVRLEVVVFARELYDELSHSYIEFKRENNNSDMTFLDHFQHILSLSKSEYADELFCVFSNDKILKLIRYFGVSDEDIIMFKDKRSDIVLRGIWMDFINQLYGTDIPSVDEYIKLDKLFVYFMQHEDTFRLYSKYDLLLKMRNGEMSEIRTDEGRVYPLMTRSEFINSFGEIDSINNMVLRRI